jgi:hypothetical protein
MALGHAVVNGQTGTNLDFAGALGFIAKIAILWTIGIILLIVGAVLWILGSMGRLVGGRRHYW